MNIQFKSFLVCCLLGSVSTIAVADQTTLNPVADTRLLSIFPDSPDGGGSLLATYNDNAANIQRSMIQFDYSTLAGATITGATLRIFGSSFNHPNFQTTTSVYRTTQSWNELEANWNKAKTGTSWATPGGDYVGSTGSPNVSPYASLTQTEVDAHWYEFDLTSLVSSQVSGSVSNFGFFLTGSTGNSLTFESRQNSLGHSPELVVTYSTVPEPGTLLVVSTSMVALLLRRKRRN
jgi:hypothetical protein